MEVDFNFFALTVDIDWAPDVAIDYLADKLLNNNIKATWFVTHWSDSIERLSRHPEIFELGWHPNFLPNSSHGKTEREVLQFMQKMLPDSKSSRSHCLVQTSPILKMMVNEFDIEIESSMLLRESHHLMPHEMFFDDRAKKLLRIPFCWEDDVEMHNPAKSWDFNNLKYHFQGLKVWNFHPMYIYLNADTMDNYEKLKRIKPLFELSGEEIEKFRNKGQGSDTVLNGFIKYIKEKQLSSHTLSEIAGIWRENNFEN